jgi:DNA-binding NarL/FixJ family response regulator
MVPRAGSDEADGMESQRDIVRVVVVDDHAAIRIGLKAAMAAQPGVACVGAAADGGQMQSLLYRTNPDVVVLDYHLPHVNGLVLCRRIKQQVLAPAVLLYSAYADPALVVPALVAGADGILHKGAPARELLEAIRAVGAGDARFPPPIRELVQDAAAAVEPGDRPILELLIERVPRERIAARMGLSAAALEARIDRILGELGVPIPVAVPGPGSLTLMPEVSGVVNPPRGRSGGPRSACASAARRAGR